MRDVQELYDGHAYDTGDFMQNYYPVWNDGLAAGRIGEVAKTYQITTTNGFQIESDDDIENKLRPTDSKNTDGDYYSFTSDTPHDDAEYGYGPSNNLIAIDEVFAKGFLSRLYDGRIHCDGVTYAQTRVQIDQGGYGTLFEKELTSYRYFAISLKGADESERSYAGGIDVNLDVTFYVYDYDDNLYIPYLFRFQNFAIMTNSGMRTTVLGFYFDLIMGEDIALLRRASAMSVTFSLAAEYDDITIDRNDIASGKDHFSLMLYEILLPHSTWN